MTKTFYFFAVYKLLNGALEWNYRNSPVISMSVEML